MAIGCRLSAILLVSFGIQTIRVPSVLICGLQIPPFEISNQILWHSNDLWLMPDLFQSLRRKLSHRGILMF